MSTTQKMSVAMFTSQDDQQSHIGASPQPDTVYTSNGQMSNTRIGVSKGGVAQSRQYKKSVNSKNSSGIVQLSATAGAK